jgi:putative transposase
MPRRPRGLAYDVLNRRGSRLGLFEKPGDYLASENILHLANERAGIRIAAYCLMPNHWHLLLWPRDNRDMRMGRIAERLGLESTLRPRGRPKGS